MGREDRTELLKGRCPCDQGDVLLVRYSPDYMYGKDRAEAEVNCSRCRVGYRASHDALGVILSHEGDLQARDHLGRLHSEAAGRLRGAVLDPIADELALRARAAGRSYEKWLPIIAFALGPSAASADEVRSQAGNCGGLLAWLRTQVTIHNASAVQARLGLELPFERYAADVDSCSRRLAALSVRTFHYPLVQTTDKA